MRHIILTLLLALAINPLEHHITNTSPHLLKLYDDNFITIEFWESYDLEKHIGKITFCYFPDSIMNQPSIIKEENIDSDSVSVFFERILYCITNLHGRIDYNYYYLFCLSHWRIP